MSVAGQTLVGGPNSIIRVHSDHAGKFLFISDDRLSAVHTYSVNQTTGLLTLASTAITPSRFPENLTVSPKDNLLYVRTRSNAGKEVLGFSISSDGSLHPVNGGNPVVPAGASVGTHVGVDLTGKFFFTATQQQSGIQVFGFRINDDGTLSPNSSTNIVSSFGMVASGLDFTNFKQ